MYDHVNDLGHASVAESATSVIEKAIINGPETRGAGGKPATRFDEMARTRGNRDGLATVGGG